MTEANARALVQVWADTEPVKVYEPRRKVSNTEPKRKAANRKNTRLPDLERLK